MPHTAGSITGRGSGQIDLSWAQEVDKKWSQVIARKRGLHPTQFDFSH